MRQAGLVTVYLTAIVAANLSLSWWGPQAAIYNAFLLIGLDLSTRDALHDMWRGRLLRNLTLLVAAGTALSWIAGLLFPAEGTPPSFVGQIALASAVAFAAAFAADALVYHVFWNRRWIERVTQSNLAGAAVDSVVLALLWPFGFTFAVVFGMFTAKVAGGVIWAMIIDGLRR